MAAMAVFEDKVKPDMEEEAAEKLVSKAVAAGVFNDSGLEATSICVSSAQANWTFFTPTQCPKRRGPGLADIGVRK